MSSDDKKTSVRGRGASLESGPSTRKKTSLRAILEAALKASPRLSVRNLARRAGMSPSELSRILAGTRNPGPAALRGLGRALGLEPAYLLHVAGILDEEEWESIARGRGASRPARETRARGRRQTHARETGRAYQTTTHAEPVGLSAEEWEAVFLLRGVSPELRAAVLAILRQLPGRER